MRPHQSFRLAVTRGVIVSSLALLALTSGLSQTAFAEQDCCWIDVKTGEKVPSVPATRENITGNDPKLYEMFPTYGHTVLDPDGKHAFNTKTGQNFVRVPCPPPGKTQPRPTPSTTDKVTDVLRTIGGSVSISIGGGVSGGGGDRHGHHGEDRHRTAEKVSTDKTKTHKTSPTTTHKTVTSACKCHPCTCSPCRCH